MTAVPSALVYTLPVIVAGLGAVYALFKLGPERQALIIDSAKGAVVIQGEVLDDLNEQLRTMRSELDNTNRRVDEYRQTVDSLRDELARMRRERDAAIVERDEARATVDQLRRDLTAVRDELDARMRHIEEKEEEREH